MSLNFIEKLSMEEKIAFMKAFVRLAMSDGELDESEKRFIYSIAAIYGIEESDREEILSIGTDEELIKEVGKIKDRRAAMELIKELCMLAHADAELSDDEMMFIGKIGQAMGLELEKIEQISQWVIDRIIWLEEGKLIFEEV